MSDSLFHILSAFGLGAASGLNASLPMLVVGLLARAQIITLAHPYDALSSDIALIGLGLIAAIEFSADKFPLSDHLAHALLGPFAIAAGAVLFASQTSAVTSVQPGAQVVIALLLGGATAGVVHTV